jgi:hypothetical protein
MIDASPESRLMFPESRLMFPKSRLTFPKSRRMFPESRLTLRGRVGFIATEIISISLNTVNSH